MYLFERLVWLHRTESRENRDRWEEVQRKEFGPSRVKISRGAREWGVDDLVDITPTDAESLFEFNDTYLDVRASFQQEKRGLITFLFFTMAIGVNGYMLVSGVLPAVFYLIQGSNSGGDRLTTEAYVAYPLIALTWCAVNFLFWRHAWPWIRVELFTQRHLIARFNRKTRQVYVNRPSYAGGVVVLSWESAVAAIEPDDPDHLGMGGFLALVFSSKRGRSDFEEVAFLGRPMRGNREIEGLWEFIRRYMAEGPQAVPRPKRLLPLWPSPVEAVRAALRFMAPMWRSSSKPVALFTGVVLSPLLILHTLCHWISLLLCWKPRWPKEIREAGLPGKPVPKLTEIDDFGPELAERIRYNDRKDEERDSPRRRGKSNAVVEAVDEK